MTISIVTAFFDIGRSEWAKRPNTPVWLARSTEQYFECFERLCRLDNEIVVFTESRFAPRIAALRARHGLSAKTRIVCKDSLFTEHTQELRQIDQVMRLPDFLTGVTQPYCPEYWEPRYVLINYLKSHFACQAIQEGHATGNFVAWIDFGYCRDDNALPKSLKWDYPFSDRIHLFNIEKLDGQNIFPIIKTNKVYFTGCHIVATREKWFALKQLMRMAFDTLVSNGLIDDDQTLLLMAYRGAPSLFEAHFIDVSRAGWFVVLKDYNAYEASSRA